MTAQIVSCRYCNSTGEGYNVDHWTGHDCDFCEGCGSVLVIDGEEFTFPNTPGLVYRDRAGRFAKVPKEALEPDTERTDR